MSRTVIWIALFSWIIGLSIRQQASRPVLPDRRTQELQLLREQAPRLKEGDLVLRLSRDPLSQLIRVFNKIDPSYSHAGLVVYREGRPMVLHAVSGDENPVGGIITVPLDVFANPQENHGFALYRYSLKPAEVARLSDTLLSWERSRIGFDSLFSLRSNDLMYCSELVMKAIRVATGNRILVEPVVLEAWQKKVLAAHLGQAFPEGRLAIVPIDRLYRNPFCSEILRVGFSD